MLLQLLIDGRLDAAADADSARARVRAARRLGRERGDGELLARGAAGDDRAALAIAMFVRRAAGRSPPRATQPSAFDALVFTGGIGEHAAGVRDAIVDRLATAAARRGSVLVVEAREDLAIAAETERVVGLR